ncbi:MAG TPA: alkaline phosphatase family protein [Methylomirabilota bacterium]|nr:alkaline phosphatase family protein [Methylomirabilota bacterium]
MKPPLSIYVLVDALGWELLRTRPFLDDVLGDRRWLTTILGYSSGAIPTLLSGRVPSAHGHWNLFYLAPDRSPFRWTRALGRLPRPLVENRVARRLLKAAARRLSGYTGYFSLYDYPVAHLPHFDLTETRDIYAPGGLACASLFDALREGGVACEAYTYHRHTDAQILALAPGRAAASDARVLFLYLSGLDHHLHFHVHEPGSVSAMVAWYEAGLRRLWEAAGRARGDVRMFVFSDHGMTPVRWTYDLRRDVAALGLAVPGDYLPAYDSTMARFWVWSERARRALTDLLADHPCGRLLDRAELERLGVWFEDGRYYHLLFLLEPGVLLCPSDMGSVRFAGMHGYHPSEPTADAVLLASVPVDRSVRHIADVHGVLLEDVGLRAPVRAPQAAA